ncbi:MAG: N-acetylmuramic acid 6-phosphate etherase [Deltaproteobacteria bacterium]|jgi:N-acetylmuramic acid 6-phosphate etherase|nr:N-acetylmuramic acid 6-phosphate etherase [Deltaproteobacteria bacterium]
MDDVLTEAVLESSLDLDRRSIGEILEAIHDQDRIALAAVGAVLPEVERAVEILVLALSGGGRWFNVGAGTSGRIGVLDAAEIPPTFGYPPDRVQGILAGGPDALITAVEGAEDRAEDARRALRQRDLLPGDAVVAISASGRTPFALAALEEAQQAGARRIAITCDPEAPLVLRAEVAIAPVVGPEVIAGSTRLKGGLAEKAVLHLLSTAVMVKLGRVEGNRMTHMRPVSSKLRRRAVGLVVALARVDEDEARRLLHDHGGCVSDAVAEARRAG